MSDAQAQGTVPAPEPTVGRRTGRRRAAASRRRSVGPLAVLVFLLLAAAVWGIPMLQVAKVRQDAAQQEGLLANERVQLENDILATENGARGTLALVLLAGVVLVGGFTAWRRFDASQEVRISERFTAAIEQLGAQRLDGAPRTETRIGGIYALERIARESDHEYWPVLEVLSAYVRDNAPWLASESAAEEAYGGPQTSPRADIQAVLTILGRRRPPPVMPDHPPLDLRGSDLRGANLVAARLAGVNLQAANLERADLSRAQLAGANLREAVLRGARLSGAALEDARLTRADAEAAHFNGGNMRGADLNGANLKGADLWQTDLSEANLRDADLKQADLAQAALRSAILWRADLDGANLEGAVLDGAHLERANLRGVLGLTWEQGESVFTDGNTVLPDYLVVTDDHGPAPEIPLPEPPPMEPARSPTASTPEQEDGEGSEVELELSEAARAAMLRLSKRRQAAQAYETETKPDDADRQPQRRKRKPPLAESA